MINRYIHSANWTIEGISSFEEYWSQRPNKLKRTYSRKLRKMLKTQGFFFSIESGPEIKKAILDYEEVYSKSWKPKEAHPEFIRAILHGFARDGRLRLGFIHYQGAPVATQIWITDSGTSYIFKLAYDPAFSSFSPGTVLTHFMAENAIEQDRVSKIDFLSGDDNYKRDWMVSKRTIYGLERINRVTFWGRLLYIKRMLARGRGDDSIIQPESLP